MPNYIQLIDDKIVKFYSDKVRMVFNYFNGKINKINTNINLYIFFYDFVNRDYGSFVCPNKVYIYISEIIYASIKYLGNINYNAIMTEIVVSCVHELAHAEQALDSHRYANDRDYRNKIEFATEVFSFNYVLEHRVELESLFNFNVDFRIDTVPGVVVQNMDFSGSYTPIENTNSNPEVEQMYRQILENEFNIEESKMSCILLDRTLDNVVFSIFELLDYQNLIYSAQGNLEIATTMIFNNKNSVQIKYNKIWSIENFPLFTQLLYNNILVYKPMQCKCITHKTTKVDPFNLVKQYGFIILLNDQKDKIIDPLR